jgi:hypothetical protein
LKVVFKIENLLDYRSSNVKFYTAEGIIKGASDDIEIRFTPSLISLQPSTGSAGGAKLTVTGVGFGINSTNVNLFHV